MKIAFAVVALMLCVTFPIMCLQTAALFMMTEKLNGATTTIRQLMDLKACLPQDAALSGN